MNTQEHMENLAQRYARALVRYHIDNDSDNFAAVVDLQNMLNMVCKELALEMTEEI